MNAETERKVKAALERLGTWNDSDYSTSSEARWHDINIVARTLNLPWYGMPHWVKEELNKATRQYRHSGDNSPDLGNPRQGFVNACDRVVIERLILRLLHERETPEGYALIRQDVVDFLHGVSDFKRVSFGELPDHERGKYWWRKFLPPSSPQKKADEEETRLAP